MKKIYSTHENQKIFDKKSLGTLLDAIEAPGFQPLLPDDVVYANATLEARLNTSEFVKK